MQHPITSVFEENSNPKIAEGQKAYMKNRFEFFGLKTPLRRELQKPFLLKGNLPNKTDAFEIVLKLWDAPQRELHYFAQELFFKYKQQLEVSDISVIECLIGHNAWWDTVDFIATKPLAVYFKKFPDQRENIVQKWLSTGDIWFQRSALLFQLKYKTEIDLELMSSTILTLKDSKEFFIKKAIGWILREYSRIDAQWVLNFVNQNELQALSKREAIRLIQTQ